MHIHVYVQCTYAVVEAKSIVVKIQYNFNAQCADVLHAKQNESCASRFHS